MAASPIGIGLLGYGTVGSAVDRLLTARAEDVARVVGAPVEVRRALVRDLERHRAGAARPDILTDDFAAIRDDAAIAVVAEVMGGVSPTREWMLELFAAGKSVVTANKQLLARHGAELFAAAAEAAGRPAQSVSTPADQHYAEGEWRTNPATGAMEWHAADGSVMSKEQWVAENQPAVQDGE